MTFGRASCEHCIPEFEGGMGVCQGAKGWCPTAHLDRECVVVSVPAQPPRRRKIWGDLVPVEQYRNGGPGRHRAPDDVPDTADPYQGEGLSPDP